MILAQFFNNAFFEGEYEISHEPKSCDWLDYFYVFFKKLIIYIFEGGHKICWSHGPKKL
jgi:hypothetical protein